jgi:hypothetical protein
MIFPINILVGTKFNLDPPPNGRKPQPGHGYLLPSLEPSRPRRATQEERVAEYKRERRRERGKGDYAYDENVLVPLILSSYCLLPSLIPQFYFSIYSNFCC